MRFRSTYKTARAVLHCDARYLLAVHSSFWAKRHRRWGLVGGRVERGEDPLTAAQREIEEELELYLPANDFVSLGSFFYKGADHAVYGVDTHEPVTIYDDTELLDTRWFTLDEIDELKRNGELHAGYELDAIARFGNARGSTSTSRG